MACCHGYEGVIVSYDDVCLALRVVRPSAMREVAIEVPKVRKENTVLQKTFKGERVWVLSYSTRINSSPPPPSPRPPPKDFGRNALLIATSTEMTHL